MKVDEMLKIFNFENIFIDAVDGNRFEEPHDQYENFHILECRGGVWSLILEIHERMHGEEVEKTFKNKDEAISYFCFYKLQNQFFDTYLDEVIFNNKIGTYAFTLNKLLEIFNKLKIRDDFYGVNSYKGNAINLISINNGKYIVEFLDGQRNLILKTKEFDLTGALFVMFKWVYMLHIMKTHLDEMQKMGLLKDGVSIEEYKVLLT